MAIKKTTKKKAVTKVDTRIKLTDRVITELKNTYRITGGNLSLACSSVGVSRDAVYKLMQKSPGFASEMEMLKEARSIKAEENINKAVDTGDIQTTKWLKEKTDDRYNPATRVQSVNLNIDAKDIEGMEGEDLLNIIANG